MPLTQQQKREALGAITEQLDAVNTVYLTDYQGLTVAQANALRRSMRAADIEFKVLKNTLLKRAMEEKGGFDELFEQLNGPTAVALSNDPAGPAKVLKKFLEDNSLEVPRFKGAFIDGAIYGEGNLDMLAKLKSKDELVADILGLLLAPITNVASALGAQGAGLASIVKQISEGKGSGGSTVETPPMETANERWLTRRPTPRLPTLRLPPPRQPTLRSTRLPPRTTRRRPDHTSSWAPRGARL